MAHIEFLHGTSTLTADGTGGLLVHDWKDLYLAGPSRGSNLTVAHMDGTVARDRDRDELSVDLGWEIEGDTDAQVRARLRQIRDYFDDAPGRQVTITLNDENDVVEEAVAQHEAWGTIRWHGQIVKVRQLLTVNAGIMTVVTP